MGVGGGRCLPLIPVGRWSFSFCFNDIQSIIGLQKRAQSQSCLLSDPLSLNETINMAIVKRERRGTTPLSHSVLCMNYSLRY